MASRKPEAEREAVAAYIEQASEPAQGRLKELAAVIRATAPEAIERMAYGLATWHQGENLVHIGAFANHVGLYPGAAAIVAFAEELTAFKTSKGAIQLPHNRPLPLDLVQRITAWRVGQVAEKPAKAKRAATSASRSTGRPRDSEV
jgi:uncharacterized protein YdhG (YjbR/CyaY superfamily)